jgi:aryl-alcohol dehydrogenase-like predicted oxidoreductase
MELRPVGGSGLVVSRLGLGTATWGRDTDPDDAAAQLVAFREAGGTLLDIGPWYVCEQTEPLVGRLLQDVVPRDELVLAVKSGGPIGPAAAARGLSRGGLLTALDNSMMRLGVDSIDLWQLHGWDQRVPMEEVLSAVDVAVSSGRARYAGVSNLPGWRTAAAAAWQRAWPGRAPLAATQVEYSLLERGVEREVLPACGWAGLGVLAYSPLGRGVLTGKYRHGVPSDSRAASPHLREFVSHHLTDAAARIVEAVATAAEGLGTSPLAVSLAWVRDRPGVSSSILGARTVGQLAGSLAADATVLPAEIRHALDDVSAPPPGSRARGARRPGPAGAPRAPLSFPAARTRPSRAARTPAPPPRSRCRRSSTAPAPSTAG